jgi:hypothetical protein
VDKCCHVTMTLNVPWNPCDPSFAQQEQVQLKISVSLNLWLIVRLNESSAGRSSQSTEKSTMKARQFGAVTMVAVLTPYKYVRGTAHSICVSSLC